MLQRTRLGGVAHRRNAYAPGNLVRWHFGEGTQAEDVAILIPSGDPRKFKVIAFNLTDKPVMATMIGDQLAAGNWSLTSGIDANGDDRADTPSPARPVKLEEGAKVPLALPPHQAVIFDFALTAPGEEPRTRADVGISGDDLSLSGARLTAKIHGLGARPSPAGTATLLDGDGKDLGTARFPALAAPVDLQPHVASVAFIVPQAARKGTLTIRLTLDGDPAEISADNNLATLGATIAEGR
jgi:hypothetical protein